MSRDALWGSHGRHPPILFPSAIHHVIAQPDVTTHFNYHVSQGGRVPSFFRRKSNLISMTVDLLSLLKCRIYNLEEVSLDRPSKDGLTAHNFWGK